MENRRPEPRVSSPLAAHKGHDGEDADLSKNDVDSDLNRTEETCVPNEKNGRGVEALPRDKTVLSWHGTPVDSRIKTRSRCRHQALPRVETVLYTVDIFSDRSIRSGCAINLTIDGDDDSDQSS